MGAETGPDGALAAAAPRLGLEDVDVQRLGLAALRLVRVIEQGDIGALWDAASALVRTSVSREAFVASLTTQRRALGRGAGRRWSAIRIDRPRPGGTLPPGTYAMLEFSSRLGEDGVSFRERVTLCLEDDGVWRLTGYQAQPD